MVVVKISDGLGNQLFQYALGRSIALKRNETLKLDISSFNKNYKLRDYMLEKFNIESSDLTRIEQIKYKVIYRYIRSIMNKTDILNPLFSNIYKDKIDYKYDKNVFETNSNYFSGYWQDYRYFNDIRSKLIKELTLKEKLNDINQATLINIKNTNSVSIHVRRGDYLNIEGQEVCDLEYYKKSIDYIKYHVIDPTFFIFSDDITWVKQNILIENVYYVDFNSKNPEFDVELMKNCQHNIIANSTFSWWAAWLNNNNTKIVIEPLEWKKGSRIPNGLIYSNCQLI